MTALSKHKQAARASYAASLRGGAPPQQTAILPEPRGLVASAIGWEGSTPRCRTCIHCRNEKTMLNRQTTRLPVVIIPPVCRRGKFVTRPEAVCDFWAGKDGTTLEALAV
jgi:hypothetical protein